MTRGRHARQHNHTSVGEAGQRCVRAARVSGASGLCPGGPRLALMAGLALCAVCASGAVGAQTSYHAQGDVLLGASPGIALVTLQGDARLHPWLSSEALVWTRYGDQLEGDALVMAVRARDPGGAGELKLGRFVNTTGALRPAHIDGAFGKVRLPLEFALETFGGVPVAADYDDRAYDWTVGGRVSHSLGDYGSAGVAYAHTRDRGVLSDEELGFDAGASLASWLDLNGKLAWDLVNPGIAEMHVAAVGRVDRWRFELFEWERSPSRLLPATSIFSVLGDQPSRRAGLSTQWRAAPRLDLAATTAVHLVGSDPAEALAVRAVLRLDDDGENSVSLEARRDGGDGAWTGTRAAGHFAVTQRVSLGTEAEIAWADEPGGRGVVWPWLSASCGWRFAEGWEVGAGAQISATPTAEARLDGLVRLTAVTGGAP